VVLDHSGNATWRCAHAEILSQLRDAAAVRRQK
jgi:hypothetical protein